ncbi:hypothetical protein L1887_59914 [Cichorium endivia]|nr:hypothetical protein L1887_59914 [Cichorium endivia]
MRAWRADGKQTLAGRLVAAATTATAAESTASATSATTTARESTATSAAESTTASAATSASEAAAAATRESTTASAAETATASWCAAAPCATSRSASCTALLLGCLCQRFRLGQESLDGQQLLARDEHLVFWLERSGHHARVHLDGEVDLVDGSKDLIDLADLRLVLEAIESWHGGGQKVLHSSFNSGSESTY